MAAGIPTRLSAREGRKFAFTLSIAFLVLGGFTLYRARDMAAYVFGGAGAVFAMLGVVVPSRLWRVHGAWMSLAHLISKVTTPLFLGIVYFLVITPMGLIRRLFGLRSLQHQPVDDSYWHQTAPRADHDTSMTKQF